MAYAKALPRWPGVSGIVSFAMTYQDGITPSTASLEVVPQRSFPFSGALTITYGGTVVALPDCRVQDVEQQTGENGETVWRLTIADRRWRWKNSAVISGYYNVRRNAVDLLTGTERKPRELAKMLLDAMGEKGYDLSALPDDTRPEVTWDASNPAEELARLVESLGCRIVLTLGASKVRIVKAGEGAKLTKQFAMEGSLGIDPPDPPGKLLFVGARTEFQGDFFLAPVGREVDGTVKPIERLSYRPPNGWQLSDADYFNDVVDPRRRHLAQESVWRWYRIEPPFRLPGVAKPIESRELILPLLSEQLEKYKVDGIERPREAWVWGQFWRGTEAHRNDVNAFDPDAINKPKGLYTQGFSVDTESGIVKFSAPVYRLIEDPREVAGMRIAPALIYLRIACNLRLNLESREWLRYRETRTLSTEPALKQWTQVVKRDDVTQRVFMSYVPPGGIKDNVREVQKAAQHYLDAVEAEYRVNDVGSVSYAGIFRFELDGAVRQVTWSIDSAGRAITRASRNREELVVAMSYTERRFYERLAEVGKRQAQNARVIQQDQQRNRG